MYNYSRYCCKVKASAVGPKVSSYLCSPVSSHILKAHGRYVSQSEVKESLCNQLVCEHIWPPNIWLCICLSLTRSLSPITHSLRICLFQVFRSLWRAQDFPRVQVRASRCRLVPWTPPSHSHLWWRPERRDPPARWARPSCPGGPTAAWRRFRVSLELQVRHLHMYIRPALHVPQHCFMCLLFLFYFVALPHVKSTDSLKPSTPLISGKCSFFLCCITTEPVKSGWNYFSFDPQMWTCPTDRHHRNPPRLQVRVYSLHGFLPLLI